AATPDLSSTDSAREHAVDVEPQATDLAVWGSNPSRRAIRGSASVIARRERLGVCVTVLAGSVATAMPGLAGWSGRPPPAGQRCGGRGRPAGADAPRNPRVCGR